MNTRIFPIDPGTVPRSLQPEIDSDEPEAIAARRCLQRSECFEEAVAGKKRQLKDLWQQQWECLQAMEALEADVRTAHEEADQLIRQLRDRLKVQLRPRREEPSEPSA